MQAPSGRVAGGLVVDGAEITYRTLEVKQFEQFDPDDGQAGPLRS